MVEKARGVVENVKVDPPLEVVSAMEFEAVDDAAKSVVIPVVAPAAAETEIVQKSESKTLNGVADTHERLDEVVGTP